MFEVFFRLFTYNKLEMVLILSLVEHQISPFLSLFFFYFFHQFEWFVSYFRGSFCPNFNFLRRMEWFTVSKAFDRSMNTPSVYFLFPRDSIIPSLLSNYTTARSVERPSWKPNSLGYKILIFNQVFVQTIIHYALEDFRKAWENR